MTSNVIDYKTQKQRVSYAAMIMIRQTQLQLINASTNMENRGRNNSTKTSPYII